MSTEITPKIEKKKVTPSNIILGAVLTMTEVTTLGQPIEVTKTTMAANRDLSFIQSIAKVWSRGGFLGFYQGLIPWAWIEACTKGGILLFVSSEVEYRARVANAGNFMSGIVGGITGGVVQSYTTMGFCTCMKTVEITRRKNMASTGVTQSSWDVFKVIWAKEGWRGINKGVNAVALRQMTNWGSRFGFSRLVENGIKKIQNKGSDDKLSVTEKILASAIGGGLSAWNQPIEVIRVEMQSKTNDPNRPQNLTVMKTLKYVYNTNGIKGLYRGVTPRIGLGVWQTVFMVGFGDMAKEKIANYGKAKPQSLK
ncbi:hypothetical protein TBLA_0D00730 [Henningerozyma blattae CBS 6284]|uniref:Mitochondrial DNA replication protein YHM2 n=1 Tax=Henningerozyma blattae (strain ATCC 34711 / CBS 6284 / DSM 70876 / NBRC 10599 / NRRL Y-10934 / UCD 77-7) TaxID=1071380 RepID=I2H2H9_HENB6|nr:hypothetical protein TBLA_0D00730 [Tetrapisispora blattae CBS 6284]CCH60581.1 hypothetical protein TBLA_0D00730 [Tetrapisispora blattae CBS 6284]